MQSGVMIMNDTIYTIPEGAQHLKLSRSKVYLLVTQKKIPFPKPPFPIAGLVAGL